MFVFTIPISVNTKETMINVILVMVLWLAKTVQPEEVVTAQGVLKGEMHQGYISYNGIPYASIRDNASRFKRAGLAPTWHGIRVSQPTRCSSSTKPEECLKLDVHVPTADAPWPVLVWIAGGSGRYNPGKLTQQGIVVVVIYHRFGPLGFLCLGEEKIPGNAGLKDAVLGLRWVRDNISAFKGNPFKVVVAGQGFGAAMVETLLLTPMAENLFHGAIMQSGSILCPWAFNFDAKERALVLYQMLNNADIEDMALVNASIQDLATNSDKIEFPYIPFGICVEKSFKYEERLLTESPYRSLSNKNRRVPLIMGYNSDEAYIFLSLLRRNKLRKRTPKRMSMLLPEELKFLNEAELTNVVEQIQEKYFKNNFTVRALLGYHSDAYFVNHILRSARLHAASALPVYLYRFSHASQPGVTPDHGIKKTGAAHSDELAYLFPDKAKDMRDDDGVVQQHLVRLWTHFVKHLEPPREEPRWEPVTESGLRLLDISTELVMQHVGITDIWDDIYERFYNGRHQIFI